MDTTFPDQEFFQRLIAYQRKKIAPFQSPLDELVMLSGAALNWLGDIFSDPNITWTLEKLDINTLWLTGTGPEWNDVIIRRCERSPAKLRRLLTDDPDVANMFGSVAFDPAPILIRFDDSKLKVLDGMHRTIGAIREGRDQVGAWVARPIADARPSCEPHVVYDLIRAYQRKLNTDRAGLIAALRFLRAAYANVDQLLRERFNKEWLPDDKMQSIIAAALMDE